MNKKSSLKHEAENIDIEGGGVAKGILKGVSKGISIGKKGISKGSKVVPHVPKPYIPKPPMPPPLPKPKLKQSSKVTFGKKPGKPKLSFKEEILKKHKNMGLNPKNTSKKTRGKKKAREEIFKELQKHNQVRKGTKKGKEIEKQIKHKKEHDKKDEKPEDEKPEDEKPEDEKPEDDKKEDKKEDKKDTGATSGTGKLMRTSIGILRTLKNIIKDNMIVKIILTVIVLFLLLYVIKYIYKYSNIYPRPFFYFSFLNMAGKFDKSTGLDLELSDILSDALTQYIYTPSKLIDEINKNSKLIVKSNIIKNTIKNTAIGITTNDSSGIKSSTTEISFLDTLKKNLFENYNVNNKLFELLRKFIEYGDIVFQEQIIDNSILPIPQKSDKYPYIIDTKIAKGNKYLQLYYETVEKIPDSSHKSNKDTDTTNKYNEIFEKLNKKCPKKDLKSTVFHKSINKKLECDIAVELFIANLKEKENNIDWDDYIEKSKDKIKTFFENILKTQSINTDSTKNKIEIYKNIFYRNILYKIILDNNENVYEPDNDEEYDDNTVNDTNDIVNQQLSLLENNNILTYINPEIYKSIHNSGIKVFENYGRYLHINQNGNITLFKNLLKSGVSFPNFIKDNILSNKYNFKSKNEIINDIKNRIHDELMKIKNNKYLQDDYNLIFKELMKYKDVDEHFDIKDIKDMRKYYENYKNEMEKNRNKIYDSENKLVNEIYNFQSIKSDNSEIDNIKEDIEDLDNLIGINSKNNIYKNFNIHKVNHSIKKIFDVFNYLIIFENFYDIFVNKIIDKNYNNDENNDIYNELIKYLWYFEKFTTLTYENSEKHSDMFLLNDDYDKKDLLSTFYKALNLSLYIKDMDIINTACYCTIALYKHDSDKVKESLLDLSKYYMSFMEIKLAYNFINDVKEYKENRTYFDVYDDFLKPEWIHIGRDSIWNKIVKKDWTFNHVANSCSWIWDIVCKKLSFNSIKCISIPDQETRTILGITNCSGKGTCDINEDYQNKDTIENFGLFSSLNPLNVLEAPFKAIGSALKVLPDIAKAVEQIPDLITKIFSIFPQIANFIKSSITSIIKIVEFIFNIIDNIGKLNASQCLGVFIGIFIYLGLIIIKLIVEIPFPFFDKYKHINKDGTNEQKTLTIALAIIMFLSIPVLICITIVKSSILLLTLLIFTLIALIVWALDKLIHAKTGKFSIFSQLLYKFVFSCENSPFAWYKNSRYDLENKNSRGLICNLTCSSNFKLSENKMFCEASTKNVPYYCPQPLLYRYYKNEKQNGPSKIKSFFINNYPNLLLSSYEKQSEFIMNYKQNKKNYYEKCQLINSSDGKTPYRQIAKNICAHGYNGNDQNIHDKINNICKEIYCSNGTYEDFCYKYQEENTYKFDITKSDNKYITYTKRTFLLIIMFYISVYILRSLQLLKDGKSSLEVNNNLSLNNHNMSDFFQNIHKKFKGLTRQKFTIN